MLRKGISVFFGALTALALAPANAARADMPDLTANWTAPGWYLIGPDFIAQGHMIYQGPFASQNQCDAAANEPDNKSITSCLYLGSQADADRVTGG